MQSGPSWGWWGLEKRREQGGGRGTQTASLNQQHFLNIFNVKTNSKKKTQIKKEIEAMEVAPKFGSDFEIRHFILFRCVIDGGRY